MEPLWMRSPRWRSGVSKSFARSAGARCVTAREMRKLALDDVSLRVERGEIVGIVGLNGSGKSTLVRVLATLTTPDTGTVRVFGRDVVDDAAEVRRHINRVSVDAAFAKEMSPGRTSASPRDCTGTTHPIGGSAPWRRWRGSGCRVTPSTAP